MIESALTFIEQNSQWAVWLIFIIAFMESIFILGLLMPGWILLVGVGALVGSDVLEFYPVVFSACLGAILGEYLSYLLGYYLHDKILLMPMVKRHQSMIDYSRTFFHKHGIAGVFIGRFFGPTRAFIPFLAAISDMRHFTFVWVNIVSGILWAPLYLVPGILAGAAFKLDKETSYTLIFILALLFAVFFLVTKYSQKFLRLVREKKLRLNNFIELLLAWSIMLVSVSIFIQSPYWSLLKNIFIITLQKI